MLAVARRRAEEQGVNVRLLVGDAHALDFRDRSFDVAVSLRVLMHTPDWRRCLAELCRVADQLVIIDYPSARSAALLHAMARRVVHALGGRTEPYRVFSGRTIAAAFRASGFDIRSVHRQFVLPIQLAPGDRIATVHRILGGLPRPAGLVARLRLSGHARGRAVRVLVTGATGFTGGHLARALASGGHRVRALVRDPARAADLAARGVEIALGDLRDPAVLPIALAGIDVVYHIAAIYRQAGVSKDTYRAVNATAVGRIIEAAAAAGARRVVHCSTVGVHGDIEHPPANEDAPLKPGDIYQATKLEGERLAREAGKRLASSVTIVRPTGIYGPGDRRLLKLFRGVARGRFPILGRGEIYYHLTYIDDLVEGFRLCGEHPAAANRTYILAGGEVTTLNELVAMIADVAGVRPLASICRCGRSGWPARCARPPARRLASSRRSTGAASIFSRRAARSTSRRARQEIGYAPRVGLREGIKRTLDWYRERRWLRRCVLVLGATCFVRIGH